MSVHPSLTSVNFFFFTPQPRSSQSRGCHGFHRAHDPAHLSHTENRGGAHPVHYGDVGLLLVGSLGLSSSLPGRIRHSSGRVHSQRCPAQPHLLLAKIWPGIWDWRSQREGLRQAAMLLMKRWLWFLHKFTQLSESVCYCWKKKTTMYFAFKYKGKKILWKIYVVANICMEFTQYGFFCDNQQSPFKLECTQRYFLLILC